jgi:hypothetical protein
VGEVRARHAGGGLAPGAAATVLVRPECVRLAATPPAAPTPSITGRIAKIADVGFLSHCFVRLADGHEVLAYRLNGVEGGTPARFEEGQMVYLWWDEQDARVFAADPETQTVGTPSSGPA